MVVQGQSLPALRTGPRDPFGMIGPHVHPLFLNLQFHPVDRPGSFQPQQVSVEFRIPHGSDPPWSLFYISQPPSSRLRDSQKVPKTYPRYSRKNHLTVYIDSTSLHAKVDA